MFRNLARAIFLFPILFSGPGYSADFMPENDLHLEDNINKDANVTKADFDAVIDRGEELYGDIVASHGGVLIFNRFWNDSTVNASAVQFFGLWFVNMFGGMARRDEVTLDGFTLVLCHEIGHHLAGFPRTAGWAANEGQSDYFSTLSCARRFWGEEREINAQSAALIPEIPKAKCDAAWETEDDRNLCYRSMLAGKSLADVLAALREDSADFDSVDGNVVEQTDNDHPAAQCRLDTLIAGSICPMDFDFEAIPRNEQESSSQTCTRSNGFDAEARPLCWFKPSA